MESYCGPRYDQMSDAIVSSAPCTPKYLVKYCTFATRNRRGSPKSVSDDRAMKDHGLDGSSRRRRRAEQLNQIMFESRFLFGRANRGGRTLAAGDVEPYSTVSQYLDYLSTS